MPDVIWPLEYAPSEMQVKIATITTVFTNPYSGVRQTLKRDGSRWVMKITLPAFSDAWTRDIEGLIAGLEGPANTVLVPMFHALNPIAPIVGSPQMRGKINATKLYISGFPLAREKVLRRGDIIQTSPGRAHMVTEDVNSDGTGNAYPLIMPPLREDPVVGPLQTRNCYVRMNLVNDDSFNQNLTPPRASKITLEFIENLAGIEIGGEISNIDLTVHDAILGSWYEDSTNFSVNVSDAILGSWYDDGQSTGTFTISNGNINFHDVEVFGESYTVTVGNQTGANVTVNSITLMGSSDFSFTQTLGTLPHTLVSGGSFDLTVKCNPSSSGTKNAEIAISGVRSGDNAAISGNITASGIGRVWLSTSGNKIVFAGTSTEIRLRSINWFGAEGSNHVPHGLWVRSYKSIIDQIAGWGFNCIRYPFSGQTFTYNSVSGIVSYGIPDNEPLVSMTPLQVLDAIVAYCKTKGIYVVLDHHRRQDGSGADGTPIDGTYTISNWQATWTNLAQHFLNEPTVIGADLHNEPHDFSWADWKNIAQNCGNVIHTVNQNWLIFVEGVGINPDSSSYWWGGALKGVSSNPVVLTISNKLVYSPHDYGQSVSGSQNWLAYDGQTPPNNWPNNLPTVFQTNWGFIAEQNIAPIWIGEFGGHFGIGSDGSTKPHGTYEGQWVTKLNEYMNAHGVSFAYWGYPPISGDTGGLLRDDWTTVQTHKITLLNSLGIGV